MKTVMELSQLQGVAVALYLRCSPQNRVVAGFVAVALQPLKIA